MNNLGPTPTRSRSHRIHPTQGTPSARWVLGPIGLALSLFGCASVATKGGVEAKVVLVPEVPNSVSVAQLGLRRVEILPCASASIWTGSNVAHADHDLESATIIGLQGAVDLLGPSPREVAHFSPPAGAWCALRLTLEGDDQAPAVVLEADPNGTGVQRTTSESTAFVDLQVDPPVTLNADQPQHTFRLSVDIHPWVAALSTPDDPPGSRSDAVFSAVRESIALE
jgi:hypothetical protein